MMLRNYLLVAYRNFKKQKTYTFINVFGLAFGVASAMCIFLYVNDELEYDEFFEGHHDIFGLGVTIYDKDGNVEHYPVAPGDWANRIKQNLPEVQEVTKVDWFGYPTTLHHKPSDKIILSEDIRWVQSNFAEVLTLPMIKGDVHHALEQPRSLLLSETGAARLFGSSDPINQPITLKHPFIGNGQEIDVIVTGVYKDYPSNVQFKPHFIINVEAIRPAMSERPGGFDGYFNSMSFNGGFFYTYVRLKPNSNIENVSKELERLSFETGRTDSAFQAQGGKMTGVVKNITEAHFDPLMDWEFDAKGNMTYLYIFSGIALLTLIIACINYMNLATARSAKRAKEVGMRKSLGGLRSELAYQFLQESAIMALLALLISMFIVALVLPYFNTLSNKSFSFFDLFNIKMIAMAFLVMVFITLVGGLYPALVLSSFKPVEVLKGKITKGKTGDLFRKSLVALQFMVSMVMVLASVVMMRQMDLLQESKLNEQGDQILSIRFGGSAPPEKYEPLKKALLEDSDIEDVTIANHLPRLDFFGGIGVQYRLPEVSDQEYQWSQLNVDFDFPSTYSLEFVAGRDFNSENIADSSSILINEAAAVVLNKTPQEAVGLDAENQRDKRNGKIIGVVRNFPYRSMHKKIEPLIISPRPHAIDRIVYVKLPKGKIAEKIAFVEKTWKTVIPDVGFDYWFLKDEFNRMYKSERTISSLAKTFTILALVITILGLYGLASYTAEQRTKEVGIRKVMGASSLQVVFMFSFGFLKIFLIAAMVAIPLSYYLSDQWLNSFVYRTPLDFLLFFFTIMGLMLITLLTVSYETYRAATANPVTAIKYE